MSDEIQPVTRERQPTPALNLTPDQAARRQAENTQRVIAAKIEAAYRAAQRAGTLPVDKDGKPIPMPQPPTVEDILAGKCDDPDPAGPHAVNAAKPKAAPEPPEGTSGPQGGESQTSGNVGTGTGESQPPAPPAPEPATPAEPAPTDAPANPAPAPEAQ